MKMCMGAEGQGGYETGNEASQTAPDGLEGGRLRIAHLKVEDSSDLWRSFDRAVEISARTLGVDRVGVWFLSHDRARLECVRVYESRTGSVLTDPRSLLLETCPAYAKAIASRRVIAAGTARTDAQTRELTATYLEPMKIGALLDAPIFVGGDLWGVVCHEREGEDRPWTTGEIDFAVSVADMLSALLEQARRVALEKELRRAEEGSARARKNEALVRMGAGIAHDFNTVLQGIVLLTEQASGARDGAERGALLRQVVEECERGTRIVAQLLDLARPRVNVDGSIDAVIVVRALQPVLTALLSPSCPLEIETPSEAFVPAERATLEQILLNLVTNARDAMPGGGTVRISLAKSDDEIWLAVSDEGAGIGKDDADRIFDPFFTTKGEGHGSGLGLWTVATLVTRSGGAIAVTTKESGTTFTARWPAAPPT